MPPNAPHLAARRLAALVATLPMLAAAQPQAADEAELLLREIPSVFAASGFEQSASDAPSSVSVITAEDIARFGWRTLAEALGSLRGFYTGYDRVYEYVGVRGMLRPGDWNGRLLLRIDGHRANEAVYNEAMLGRNAIVDLASVERIEVVRGPGSSLYGASAVYAVVDVITKRGRDYRGLQADAEAGSNGSRGLRLAGGDRRGELEFAFSLSALERDGQHALRLPGREDAPGGGVVRDRDDESSRRAMVQARWRDFTLLAGAGDWDKTDPTGAYGTVLGAAGNGYRQQRRFLRLGHEFEPWADAQLRLAWSWDESRFDGGYVYEDGDGVDVARGRGHRVEATLDQRVDRRTRLVAGADLQRDRARQSYVEAGEAVLEDRREGRALGLFALVEHALTPTLRLNAGLRHDHYSRFSPANSPRLGVIWQPADGHALKLLAGSAYRTPNAFELHYDDGATQASNPGLRPERLHAVEAVWEGRLRPTVQATLSLWRNRQHNRIENAPVDGDAALQRYVNAGAVHSHGAEAQVDARLADALHGSVSLSWQDSRTPGSSQPLTHSPQRIGKASLVWQAPGDVSLAAELRARSSSATPSGSRVGGRALLDLNLTVPLAPRWQAAIRIDNALDRDYALPAGVEHAPARALPQPGRGITLRVSHAL